MATQLTFHLCLFYFFATFALPSFGEEDCGTCENGGSCVWYLGTCTCTADYTGLHCETLLVDDCECLNHGTCLSLSKMCACVPGYYGDKCEYDNYEEYLNVKYGIVDGLNGEEEFDCAYDGDCENGGTCMPHGVCSCDDRHTGERCDVFVDSYEQESDAESDEGQKTSKNTIIMAVVGIVVAVIAQCLCCVCVAMRNSKKKRQRSQTNAGSGIVTLRTPDGREYQGYRPQWYSRFEGLRGSENGRPKPYINRSPRTESFLSNSSRETQPTGPHVTNIDTAPSTIAVPTPAISVLEVTDSMLENGAIPDVERNGRTPPPSYEEVIQLVTIEASVTSTTSH